MASMGPLGS
uniref:Uncharacterized protein n=1 Tax=Anguilla anguilla TaxID=7936 RepID=A0A0E9RC43_ANGAN